MFAVQGLQRELLVADAGKKWSASSAEPGRLATLYIWPDWWVEGVGANLTPDHRFETSTGLGVDTWASATSDYRLPWTNRSQVRLWQATLRRQARLAMFRPHRVPGVTGLRGWLFGC